MVPAFGQKSSTKKDGEHIVGSLFQYDHAIAQEMLAHYQWSCAMPSATFACLWRRMAETQKYEAAWVVGKKGPRSKY
eukprot:4469321-Amphidinium_carterae.1